MNETDPPATVQPKPGLGTPAPWFKAAVLDGNTGYAFDTAAGRAIILYFMGSASIPQVKNALERFMAESHRYDDERLCFFGVTIDESDAAAGRVRTRIPGIRFVLDYDRAVSSAYGAWQEETKQFEPFILVLDRQLRVAGRFALAESDAALNLADRLAAPAPDDEWAPVLLVPRVLEPELCATLIRLYETAGGEESGFMREVGGKTVAIVDHSHKRRSDCTIEDEGLRSALSGRINQRLRPMIRRAFNFDATRMERYIVARYHADASGHFRPHRDNTTKGTAHRRFAVTINLNDDFEGGGLRFPEYGPQTYRAPPGGAIVFSCSLLHEARPVTRGCRYAFLPFLYDDAAAALREANNAFLGEGVAPYANG